MMIKNFRYSGVVLLAFVLTMSETLFGAAGDENSNSCWKVKTPTAPKKDHFDEYFGEKVADPYHWMETEKTSELSQWIEAENKATQDYFAKIPCRNQIRAEIEARINYPKYHLPVKKNDRYFFWKNNGLQNQFVIYTVRSFSEEPKVLLDPNKLSKDGTVSLAVTSVSQNGKYFAYSVSRSGSDWREAYVLDIESGRQMKDHLQWLKFSGLAWYKDGFFYSRFDEPSKDKKLSQKNKFHKVYYHKIGTDQSEDQLVFMNKEYPDRICSAELDKDENWLFIYESNSTYGVRISFRKLGEKEESFKVLYPSFDAETSLVEVRNGLFYMITDYKAPNRRLVAVDPAHPEPKDWKEVIPEGKSLLKSVTAAGDRLLVEYLRDAASEVLFYDYQGKELGKLKLPTLGTCYISGQKDDPEFFYMFTSYVYPSIIYRSDLSEKEAKPPRILFDSNINFKPSDYTTERLWYTSKDGTRAPVFITYKNGMKRDGLNPLLLYGYGGFNISLTPDFSPARTVFLDHGGIFAVAVLRGGGEYGEQWHKSGTKLQKQKVFDDFISAAEFLIKEKYTSKEKLAINGRSNGGLLVGAALTQRPDLFRVAVPQVGVLDMLRYHKFTIGWAWASDYGTSEESREMFQYLKGYSPLHNIKLHTNYPATLIMTSDHDDRVVPAHSFKFGAALQENNSGKNPILIRIEEKAGHGLGKPLSKIINESADIYSFILFNLK